MMGCQKKVYLQKQETSLRGEEATGLCREKGPAAGQSWSWLDSTTSSKWLKDLSISLFCRHTIAV